MSKYRSCRPNLYGCFYVFDIFLYFYLTMFTFFFKFQIQRRLKTNKLNEKVGLNWKGISQIYENRNMLMPLVY